MSQQPRQRDEYTSGVRAELLGAYWQDSRPSCTGHCRWCTEMQEADANAARTGSTRAPETAWPAAVSGPTGTSGDATGSCTPSADPPHE
ncbi:hypothetical protein J8N05_46845 (plasmid) [Streptomyces sp. BH-SS-21]|uniref:Uncharacterized protein n=1 Tax=Streptomyces liliiviolaceus TaxID=2823109 RepID=A0A940Y5N8_9ACTN|nr:hypothetical protein [Streptomyces liliiviolaceus]MBQ0855680.1 hypothetical protein [Streptomyces liliiviolaceus]